MTNLKCRRCSTSCVQRTGLTLVEVVAGIALLATLLVGIVVAAGRHGAQVRLAQRRLAALDCAEELLAEWFSQPGAMPREGSGTLEREAGLVWRTRPLADSAAERLGLEIIRLEIHERGATNPQRNSRALVSTDLVVAGNVAGPGG